MAKMTLNKAEIDVMVTAMESADVAIDDAAAAVTAASWEETESDDGHRELYEDSADIAEADYYGAEFEGHGTYEDYEPNPYDGTYSEM